VTHLSSLFNFFPFRILAILDTWSRLPVATRLFTREPRARDVACVVRQAVVQYGAPRVLVSDRAKVFRSQTLRRTVRRLRIQHRFGAVGQPGSIALLYYRVHRPHAGLGGATPVERLAGLTPAHTPARPPARDRPTPSTPRRLSLGHLDDERRFPILVRLAA
jgi:transposase InsO family protein